MQNVSFPLQTSGYSAGKLYYRLQSKQIKQMFTAILNNKRNQTI